MSQTLNLKLSDEVYQTLKQQAENAGFSLQEWIVFSLTKQSHNQEDRTVAEKKCLDLPLETVKQKVNQKDDQTS